MSAPQTTAPRVFDATWSEDRELSTTIFNFGGSELGVSYIVRLVASRTGKYEQGHDGPGAFSAPRLMLPFTSAFSMHDWQRVHGAVDALWAEWERRFGKVVP